MAVLRCGFAAEQAAAVDYLARHGIFHLALRHQREELCLVGRPFATLFLVLVEHRFRGREFRQMHISDRKYGLTEKLKIVALGESSQLRDVVKADIHQPRQSRAAQLAEKLARRLLRKSDRENFHEDVPID
jgi:hypothetical protein